MALLNTPMAYCLTNMLSCVQGFWLTDTDRCEDLELILERHTKAGDEDHYFETAGSFGDSESSFVLPLPSVYPLPPWETDPYSGIGREHDVDNYAYPCLKTFSSLCLYNKLPLITTIPYIVMQDLPLHDLKFLVQGTMIPCYDYFPDIHLDLFFELEAQPSTPVSTVQPVITLPIPSMLSPIIVPPPSPIPRPFGLITGQSSFDYVTDLILFSIL